MANKIQLRRDTSSNWSSGNPTLSQGELGHETNTGKLKVGDGSTAWNSLGYVDTTYSVGDGGLTQNNFTDADHSKLDGIATSANNYSHPNHSGEVTSTSDGATVISDNVVDEANLKVSNSPTNGYVLTAQSGNTGGLTWAAAASGGGGDPDLYRDNASSATTPTVAGTNAVAIGSGAVAATNQSIALGLNATVGTSTRGTALGYSANATGSQATAISDSTASGGNSFAAVADATASATDSIALGRATTASSDYATAIGKNSSDQGSVATSGAAAMALGGSRASGADSFAAAIANNTSSYGATGQGATVIGNTSKGTGERTVSIGQGNIASGANATAIGYSNTSGTTSYSTAIGYNNTASAAWAMALGNDSTASHSKSVSIGDSVTSTAANQVNLGGSTQAVRISESYTLPSSDGSANYVLTTNGSGVASWAAASGGGGSPDLFAENYDGSSTLPSATGTNAFGIGVGAIASSELSIALGTSRAYGTESFAAAIDNNSTTFGAGGSQAIAIGRISRAHGNQAIAIGSAANCSGNDALSIGENSTTSGRYSSTLGNSSSTSSEGASSIGYGNTINSGANSSVALGAENKNNSVAGKLTYAANDTVGSGEPAGSPKTGIQVIVAHTTDATATVATTPTSSGQATAAVDTIPALPNNAAFTFTGTIIAREKASEGSDYASWEIKGALLRDANAGSTVLGNGIVNSLYHTSGASAWAIALSADTTNGGLKVQVTGAASTNIRWAATVNTSEVIYA